MEYNRIQLRTWSMLGKRGTFGSALTEFAPIADNLMAVSADFTRSSGLERYSKVYSDKFLNVLPSRILSEFRLDLPVRATMCLLHLLQHSLQHAAMSK